MKRSEQQEKAQKFLDLEVENNLFDLVDENGVRVWDVVRFCIGDNIIWDYSSKITKTKKPVWYKIKRAFTILRASYSFFNVKKYKNLSIVNSRNKLDGKYFDQNQHDVLSLLNKDDIIFLETRPSLNSMYHNSHNLRLMQRVHKAFSSNDYIYYDFNPVINLLMESFPFLDITNEMLNYTLKMFYAERAFYSFFLKKHSIQQVFFTQNGSMAGLLSITKELGIKTFEFQHGIVNEKHFSYSYPKGISVESKSYQPSFMLRFSDYWFRDFYAPFKKITIGNNYLIPSVKEKRKKSLLVISSLLISMTLSDFLIDTLGDIRDWDIYYKLHPNEFGNILDYEDKFKNYNNLQIISDQYSVTYLLNICSVMLTIQSTAIYEALQGRCRVIIIDKGEYNEIETDNVYHITKREEFLSVLCKDFKTMDMDVPIFFDRFNANELYKHVIDLN